jgi:Cu2+-exporting ATPase
MEASSRHPVARAFQQAQAGGLPAVEGIVQYPGHGIEAIVEGVRMRIGGEAFCAELAGSPAPAEAGRAPLSTAVHLAEAKGWLASFTLDDRLRDEAPDLVRTLQAAGLRVHLVSGDREEVVAALARRLGIDRYAGGRAPQDKLAYVEALQREGRCVAMIGDGLNDAPVLARADASIAVAGGADAAQLQSDLVVLGGRIGGIAHALAIARRTMSIVRQNLWWAALWNAIALPLAMAGAIGPWEAAVGMAVSSTIVVVNALRVFDSTDKAGTWKASTSSYPSRSRSFS